MVATTTEQLGLLKDCTGFDGDPAGPWGLCRGGFVRNLRPADIAPYCSPQAAAETQTLLEYSRDGRNWTAMRVHNRELEVGDVSAIREELLSAKPVPKPPAGATRFVWCWSDGSGRCNFDYTEGKRPETYHSTFWLPTRWHSCHAFDAEGVYLGYFSPHYEDKGWTLPGDLRLRGIADSIYDAARALLGRPVELTPEDSAIVFRNFKD